MTIVWMPGNYMYYGMAEFFPQRMAEMYHLGVPVALGSDVAKVWGFGEQGQLGFLLARAHGQFLAAEEIMEMASRSGARAVGLQDRLGSLAPGMLADIVVRSAGVAESHPPANPVRDAALIGRTKARGHRHRRRPGRAPARTRYADRGRGGASASRTPPRGGWPPG